MQKQSFPYNPQPRPYALYIHGFASGANSGTMASLSRTFPQYEWIGPDVSHNPYEALAVVQEWAEVFRPELIMGTSMGGFLTLFADTPWATKLTVNPVWNMETTLRKIGYGKHPYHCPREDGATECMIDEALVRSYIQFKQEKPILLGKRNLAVFSTNDEFVGKEPSKKNTAIIASAGFEVIWNDRMGHRLNDKAAKSIANTLNTP